MFIGREKELKALSAELSTWKNKTAVLVYGKRRVGKSTLINEAAKVFDGIVVNHLCVTSTFEGNLELIFHRMAVQGKYPDIEDFGSYWYDDPVNKTNGEFDCVIRRTGDLYDFYECKFFDRAMTLQECEQEKDQLRKIQGIKVTGIGFVCAEGFDFANKTDFILIDGKTLYQ